MKTPNDSLREIRQNLGYSQESMANCLKMSQANYNRIENSKQNIPMEIIPHIAKTTGKNSEEVVKTLNGVTVQANINDYSQNNQNVVNISTEEWINKLLEEKDKRLQEKINLIEEQNLIIIEKNRTVTMLHQIISELTKQIRPTK